MVVIVAEKHSVAKAIASVLANGVKRIPNAKDAQFGHWEFSFRGEPAILTYAKGHIIQLAEPKTYGEAYAKWDISVYPLLPEIHRRAVSKGCEAGFEEISFYLKKADWIISATDNDREGDIIFREIYDFLELKTPYKKAVFDDPTDEEIIKAFSKLQEGKERRNIEKAGEAREIIDYDIGNNLTVLATRCMPLQVDGTRSKILQGRVKTSTLSLIAKRDSEIANFKPHSYYRVQADFGFLAEYPVDFKTKEEAQRFIEEKCIDKKCKVNGFEIKNEKETAKKLYNTTAIQSDANKYYGYTPAQTSKALEKLYLPLKYSTYPRTKSTALLEERKDAIKSIIKNLMATIYKDLYLEEGKWSDFSKKHFDDKKVSGHPAIVPTSNVADLTKLEIIDSKVYDLICRSVIALVYPNAVTEKRTAVISVGKYEFKGVSQKVICEGWKVIYKDFKNDNKSSETQKSEIPQLSKGQLLTAKDFLVKEVQATPPKAYTLGTLVKAMETAGQDCEDEEIAEIMRLEGKALGTDATRDSIIDSLLNEGYIALSGNTVHVTRVGKWIIDNLPVDDIKDVMFTAEMERDLYLIQNGKLDYIKYCKKVQNNVRKWSEQLKSATIPPFNLSSTNHLHCPNCKGNLITRGADAKYWLCENFLKEKGDPTRCSFCVPQIYKGAKLSLADLKSLSEGKPTSWHTLVGYKKEDVNKEQPFKKNCYLTWDKENGRITEMSVIPKVFCPICHAEITATANGYECRNYEYSSDNNHVSKCDFYIPNTFLDSTITITDLKHLVKGENTTPKKLKSKEGKSFTVCLKYNVTNHKIEFDTVLEGVSCPICKGHVITMGEKGWACENFVEFIKDEHDNVLKDKDGYAMRKCSFYIPCVYYDNKLSLTDLKNLCSGRPTKKLNFVSKAGKPYQSVVVYDKEKRYLKRDFEAGKLVCPVCKKGEVRQWQKDGKKGWFCTNTDCSFRVFEKVGNIEITDSIVKQICEGGYSRPQTFYSQKKNKEYKVRLKWNYDKQCVDFDFIK